MAEILPFRALHYNPQVIQKLEEVVTQPYDKITPEMQARYHDLSPYNLARVIRGIERAADTPEDNVYTRAAKSLREWIGKGVLVSEREPALYPYYQEYSIPGDSKGRKRRRGFIALARLEDYTAGVVHRHEETLSAPKADRLQLLNATRAHFGQIFVLYSDANGSVEAALDPTARSQPWERLHDEYSALHSVWRVTDPATIERVVGAMREKKLVIADGHHRYETALAYRNHCRAQGTEDPRAEYVMMTFVRLETDGLTILPTHRVLHSLPKFDWTSFLQSTEQYFEWTEISVPTSAREAGVRLVHSLRQADPGKTALGVFAAPGRAGTLQLRKDRKLEDLLPDVSAGLRRLDVVILHRILIERVLGIDRDSVRKESNLRYARESEAAIEQVNRGEAALCFLMNPTPVGDVWVNALSGNVLPQKSTDFYPKLLSGLTIYWLDNPAGI